VVGDVPVKTTRPLAFVPPAGQVWRSYYSAGAQRIAMRVEGDPNAGNNGLFYLLSDHLGSTSVSTDANGNVTARQWYHPYGSVRSGGGLPTDIGFTGQRAESGLGSLMYFRARFYSPYLNRWLQPDLIVPEPGNPQALNRYSFVYNNPIKYTDSTGHFTDQELIDLGVFSSMDEIEAWRNSPNLDSVYWYYFLRAAQLGDQTSGFLYGGTLGQWSEVSGMFEMVDGRLSFTSTSGEQFRVAAHGFQSLSSGNWIYSSYVNGLTKSDGQRLATLDDVRQYVLPSRSGSNVVADWTQIDVGWCYFLCISYSKRDDQYHQEFRSLALGIGSPGPIVAATAGNLDTSYVADAVEIRNHSTGWGVSISGGTRGGVILNASSVGPNSTNLGLMWPGVSLMVSYSWMVP
jgi:RHS repeat-associated protein